MRTWITATIIDSLDGMIHLRFYNDQQMWVYYDMDRLGPHMKVQLYSKNDVDFYR